MRAMNEDAHAAGPTRPPAQVGRVRIGISGWRYPPWRGVFYPEELRQKDELSFASRTFSSIELNGSFYSLQRPQNYAAWAADTPEDFVFSLKGPRYITHILRLKQVEAPLANFLASGLLELGPKLGPILWQFPPFFKFDPVRVEAFFRLLPHDSEAAARLAARHDQKVAGRAALDPKGLRPVRHAMEIRNQSFVDPAFIALLRAYDVALVCADTPTWPSLMDLTSDFVYCRLHGAEELYASGYDAAALDRWCDRVLAWAGGGEPTDGDRVVAAPGPMRPARDVFVYFDNDVKVRAPFDAQQLERRVRARQGGA